MTTSQILYTAMSIGWKHIYARLISKQLIKTVDDHYKTEGVHGQKHTGERWAQQLIKLIWDTMLALWKEQNNIINQQDLEAAKIDRKEQVESTGSTDAMNLVNGSGTKREYSG
jgi:hypothetical protein